MRLWLATGFAILFLIISITLAGLSARDFVLSFYQDELIAGLIRSLNEAFIALATFELGFGIAREYRVDDDGGNVFFVIRRTITRFVSVVIIALVLEGLMMVIKYSQLELAGNLYYPVAVIISAGLLLVSLAVFLNLSRKDTRMPDSLSSRLKQTE